MQVVIVLDVVKFAVKQHAFAAARHVQVGQVHLQVALYGAVFHELVACNVAPSGNLLLVHLAELVVLQLRHRLVQDFLVSLVAKVFHESALLRSEQIARPADVKVLHGEVKSATKFGESLKRFEPAPRLLGERRQRRSKQIAERLAVAAAHAAAHLVQV